MWLPSDSETPSSPPTDQVSLLWMAVGSVEAPSQHPLGKALHARSSRLLTGIPTAEDWHSVTGFGCEAHVPGIGFVRVGKRSWVCEAKCAECQCVDCKCSLNQNCGCRCWEERSGVDTPSTQAPQSR